MIWPWLDGEQEFRERSRATADPDTRIAWTVVDRLGRHARLRRQRVTVEVQDRVLILTGTVDSRDTLDALTAVAREVDEVRDVCTMVRVSEARGDGGATADAFDNLIAGLPSERAAAPSGNRRTLLIVLVLLAWGLLSLMMVVVGVGVTIGVTVVVGGVLVLLLGHRSRRRSAQP